MHTNKKGQIGGRILTVIFGTIMLVAVAIPITIDIASQTQTIPINATHNQTVPIITGTTAIVVGFIPLFLALAGLALAAALISQ